MKETIVQPTTHGNGLFLAPLESVEKDGFIVGTSVLHELKVFSSDVLLLSRSVQSMSES